MENIKYKLDLANFTASITNSPKAKNDIFIPCSIICNNHEYIITNISQDSFKQNEKIQSLTFSTDSQLQIIGKNSFQHSNIKTIFIPKSVIKIEAGSFSWCKLLNNIQFDNFSKLEIINKGAFSGSGISEITIPKSVEKIDMYFINMYNINIKMYLKS